MTARIILTGDVNLNTVTDPERPFAVVREVLLGADVVFSNLECCLYDPPQSHFSHAETLYVSEGIYVPPVMAGKALRHGGIQAVGLANNVNFGSQAILGSIASLDSIGIAHTGAGTNITAARAPAVIERNGLRVGILQRSSVYWPTDHEAGEHTPGIAVLRGHTAYQVPEHRARPELPPMNRPGLPPKILTWANPDYLNSFCEDIRSLRARADVVVASCHWGIGKEPLEYMVQIAHAAIEAGADVVMGHGPHNALPVGIHKGKPIFYGLGSFSFAQGHRGKQHGDWLGMMVTLDVEASGRVKTGFRFVRHNDRNETLLCAPAAEKQVFATLDAASRQFGATFDAQGDDIIIFPAN